MPKFVYVQMRGNEKPAKVRADKIEDSVTITGRSPDAIILKIGEEKVGEFKHGDVQGWWIEDEPDEKK